MNEREINPDVQRYIESMEKELHSEKMRRMGYENDNLLSGFSTNKDPNLLQYFLDLEEELEKIYHLLSGHILTKDVDGVEVWTEPKDDRQKIFSDYGVKQLMNIISFYVNPNTLLSFYDEETIKWKVRDFGIELADLIFNRYEVFFYYPTPEELFDKYVSYLKDGKINMTEDQLYAKCIQWSREELQQKFRHYPMMVLAIMDTVHSTYLRALGGKTLRGLTEHVHVSQNANMGEPAQQMKQSKFWNPKTW